MARYVKENLRVYDEPITISKFTGGINNTPANESMQDNELRDAINWHYNETVLERRLGGKIIADLVNIEDETLFPGVNIARRQGTFIYGIGDNTYIIHIVDGRIFYSLIEEDLLNLPEGKDLRLDMSELTINITTLTKLMNYNGGGVYNITGQASNELEGLVLYCNEDTLPDTHDGYLYTNKADSNATVLRLQNTKPMEGIGIADEFRLASGTRYIRIYESNDTLVGEVVQPVVPTGWEYSQIGLNRLSPYPLQLAQSKYDAVSTFICLIKCGNLKKYLGQTDIDFEAILDFPAGKTVNDYYFRWDAMKLNSAGVPQTEWVVISDGTSRTYSSSSSKGCYKLDDVKTAELCSPSAGDKILVRCSFAERFETVSQMDELGDITTATVTETVKYNTKTDGTYSEGTKEDFKVDVLGTFGSVYVTLDIVAQQSLVTAESIDSKFQAIHSCRKIISNGSILILYDDTPNTGNWYKAVVEKYNYFVDKGILNFQTNKNEKLIRAKLFEGNIVCFAYNQEIGGNISVVLGSGDDVDAKDGYYSPYRRKIVNTDITADHPNTIQVIENSLVFKFRDTIYLIDSKQLDADRVDAVPVNDKLKHYTWLKDIQYRASVDRTFDTANMIQMPNIHDELLFEGIEFENRIFSEVTEDYYALIYPEQKLRWKMYFKLPLRYEGDPKIYYPWLRDISDSAFDVSGTCYIKGISTLVTNSGKLVQFTGLTYKDLDSDTYSSKLVTKAYDLGYPKFIKFLKNLNVYYYRDYIQPFTLDIEIKNEADVDIYGLVYKASLEHSEDDNRDTIVDRIIYTGMEPIEQKILVADYNTIDNAILGPQPVYTSKVFTPINMRPFLSISVILEIADATNVTIGSIGFNFVTAHQPDESMQNYYPNIINF